MKRQIIKEFASIDSNQSTDEKESLTSVLVSKNSPVCDFLKKKIPTGNYNHLKTFDAWNRRIGNVTLKELEETKSFLQINTELYKEYEASLLKPQPTKVSKLVTNTNVEETSEKVQEEPSEEETVNMNENNLKYSTDDAHISLSDVDLTEQRKEEIQLWYTNALENLQSQKDSLRSEQFRRRKAQLRVEYWAKMDKEINKATPTVVMF